MKRMIGNFDSGVEIRKTDGGGGIVFTEYTKGEKTGEVVFNQDEIEELIDILKELVGGNENVRK